MEVVGIKSGEQNLKFIKDNIDDISIVFESCLRTNRGRLQAASFELDNFGINADYINAKCNQIEPLNAADYC